MDAYLTRCLTLLRSGKPVIILDLETTGLLPDYRNPDRPRPQAWEIGMIHRVRQGLEMVRSESRVIMNIGPLPTELIEWNKSQGVNIDPDITVREGCDQVSALRDLVNGVRGAVVVGHNIAGFDGRVLVGDLRAAGIDAPGEISDPALQVDTLVMAQTLWPRGVPGSPVNHKLATMAEFVGHVDTSGVFHQALQDARATESILVAAYNEATRREVGQAT